MPDLTAVRRELLDACASSDIPALEKLLQKHNVPTHLPATEQDFEQSEPASSQLPSRSCFFFAAIIANQPATLRFLFRYFPGSDIAGHLITALRVGDLELVRTVCELEPSAPNTVHNHMWPLAYAAWPNLSCPRLADPVVNGKLVTLLLEKGADPNEVSQHTPPISNAETCVNAGLPASVFERFFDHGYRFNDPLIVRDAIREKRTDVLEVLFRRGKLQKGARWPPKAELLEKAREVGDEEVLKVVKRIVPEDYDLDVWKVRGVPKWRTWLYRPFLQASRDH